MNRKETIKRHSPLLTEIDPVAPLSLGNGDFGMSVDFTGLQTFPEQYQAPLSTQSSWGWHATGGKDRFTLEDITFNSYRSYQKDVPYPLFPEDKEEAYHWLRQNPHRLQLGQCGLQFFDEAMGVIDSSNIIPVRQYHDLYTGIIKSDFEVDGIPVSVETACASDGDVIGVKIDSVLIKDGRVGVKLAFPSPSMHDEKWENTTQLDWGKNNHETRLKDNTSKECRIERTMDDTSYQVALDWSIDAQIELTDTHTLELTPEKVEDTSLYLTIAFSKQTPVKLSAPEVIESSTKYWQGFWENGGFISFEGSTDPRAQELERRVILSLYLTAVHSSGHVPPQETGFMYNSWFGKFHLEMHWWHGAHFPLWNRENLLERSMQWYIDILPKAYALAKSQGYIGARWPKMVGPEGDQTPSPIAPGLIWQQPHPIALLELIYQTNKKHSLLEKYKEIVFSTADFMSSYAHFDEKKGVYVLGPPLIPAQENHKMEDSINPPYELEYWHEGLSIAIEWKERLEEQVPKIWIDVRNNLATPPSDESVYLAHSNCTDTFTEKNHDHPSMVAALGVLPGNMIDKEKMRQTLYKVKDEWQWNTAWGWDFPMCAMTAARLGEGELAIDFLLMDQVKNTYLVNGQNYQHDALTTYLPGNGGLLTAVAMMAKGFSGSEKEAPGFPDDGSWKIELENIFPLR
ncbi:glycoside hydrolase family 65 [Saliterribacillus persicus]|uniref:Glycosyl hydrolase family 65 n=1 Tax=Saliterribacillus persicus TaxID=930114 RepID=A0A368YAI9_9BACI|nr:glycoside hydrolase family 65 [Saliterribacillus persicus]RCW77222.1 hypothetical protein DFR57_10190 [Saliterribacillus persicus]